MRGIAVAAQRIRLPILSDYPPRYVSIEGLLAEILAVVQCVEKHVGLRMVEGSAFHLRLYLGHSELSCSLWTIGEFGTCASSNSVYQPQ